MSGSYSRLGFSGDILDDLNVDIRGKSWSFSGSLLGVFKNEHARLIPSIGVTHTRTSLTFKALRQSESSDDSATSLDAGFSLVFDSEDGTAFHIGPGVSVTEEGTTFSLSIGIGVSIPETTLRGGQPPRRQAYPPYPPDNPRLRRAPSPPEPTPPPEEVPLSRPTNGEQLPIGVLVSMTNSAREHVTVSVAEMDSAQVETLARVFKVPPGVITTFRWGNSAAPSGHPHYQTTWLTLSYGEGVYKARETIRIDGVGAIIERTKE